MKTLNFNPRAPCGARRHYRRQHRPGSHISIHAPRAGRDYQRSRRPFHQPNFNPRTPRGARLSTISSTFSPTEFQSTHPSRGATIFLLLALMVVRFQSTHPMRGATFTASGSFSAGIFQSTRHAPRAGRDCTMSLGTSTATRNFNPRAPCGARLKKKLFSPVTVEFQSTRPMRGATTCPCSLSLRDRHFNPRAPCGARRPTRKDRWEKITISIHAPHAGRDSVIQQTENGMVYFNPRAPCGARRYRRASRPMAATFQSTRPMRGATTFGVAKISPYELFQSTRPMRGATSGGRRMMHVDAGFQSTRPMRGATRKRKPQHEDFSDFNPRAPCGARRGANMA